MFPVPEVAVYASVCFPRSRMMAKVRTSVGFALPNSSFAEAPKSESIAIFGTVLSFRHRLGVF